MDMLCVIGCNVHKLFIKLMIIIQGLLRTIFNIISCQFNLLFMFLRLFNFLGNRQFPINLSVTFGKRFVIHWNFNRTSSIDDDIEQITIIIIFKNIFFRFKKLKLQPFCNEFKILIFPVVLLFENIDFFNKWNQESFTVLVLGTKLNIYL
jgi:hypothetical protein